MYYVYFVKLFLKIKEEIKNREIDYVVGKKEIQVVTNDRMTCVVLPYIDTGLQIAEQTCKTIMTKTSYALLELRWLLQFTEDQNRVLFSKEGATHDSM